MDAPAVAPVENGGNANDDDLAQLRERVQLLQQIQSLQLAIATPNVQNVQNATVPKNVKVPEGRYNMSLSEYRTYSKDCIDYKTLTGYRDDQIVLQMRLNMDSDLKQAIDTNYPMWRSSTVERAVEIVGEIVNQISNCAVYRKQFHTMVQSDSETIREFVTNLRSCAADCLFVCPFDDSHDLTDVYIIDRIRSGVHDPRLQQELLQKQSTLNEVQLIVEYCEDFESAKRDRGALTDSSGPSVAAARLGDVDERHPELRGVAEEEIVAALSAYRRSKKQKGGGTCRQCGNKHGRGKCPASGHVCLNCGKMNHFSRVCESEGPSKGVSAAVIISAVVGGERRKDSLARLSVLVFVVKSQPQAIEAIPDTGAEVTVAGECHMESLGIKRKHLIPPPNQLKHVAGGRIKIIGCCRLMMSCWGIVIVETVYFIADITTAFLSLDALRQFGIIHKEFPRPIAAIQRSKNVSEGGINQTEPLGSVNHDRNFPLLSDMHHQQAQEFCYTQASVQKDLAYDSPQGLPAKGVGPTTEVVHVRIPEVNPPVAPTEENIPALRKFLIDTFKTVFDKERVPFPAMRGKDLHIHLIDANAEPFSVHTPLPVPFHLQKAVDELLEKWVNTGNITPVAIGEPVNWCTRLVVVSKKGRYATFGGGFSRIK